MDYKYDFHIIKKGEYLQEDGRVSKAIEHFHYENEDVICITAFGNPSAIYTFNNAKKYHSSPIIKAKDIDKEETSDYNEMRPCITK